MMTDYPDDLRYQFQTWTSGVAMALAKLQMYKENQALNEMRLQYGRDELTGIPNRREMERALQKQYDRLRQKGESFFVVSVDMDGLKYINDHFGHLEGDEALRALARILAAEQGRRGLRPARAEMSFRSAWPPSPREWWRPELPPSGGRFCSLMKNRESLTNCPPASVMPDVTSVPLLSCLQQADKNMYQEKRGKKHARKPE